MNKKIKGPCWVKGFYDSSAGECKLCFDDDRRKYSICQKVYKIKLKQKEEGNMGKIILKKKGLIAIPAKDVQKKVLAPALSAAKKTVEAKSYAGVEYKEGTGSWILVSAVRKLKRASIEKVLKLVAGKFGAANPEGRAKHVLDEACSRNLIKKNEDGTYSG
jgi:hypothetical protein